MKQKPVSPIEAAMADLQTILTGARSNAARLDGPALDATMRLLDTWMSDTRPLLGRDRRLRDATADGLRELRDLCSILTGAISDGLAAATNDNTSRGYGPARHYDAGAAAPVLTRRYG